MAIVTFIPLGNKIKFVVRGQIKSTSGNRISYVNNSGWYYVGKNSYKDWIHIFGSKVKVKKFLKRNKNVTMDIPLEYVGYYTNDEVC